MSDRLQRQVQEAIDKVVHCRDEQHRRSLQLPDGLELGYAFGQFMSNAHPTMTVFGVGGLGGSHAYAARATGTTFALTKNLLTPNFDKAEHIAGIVTKEMAGDTC